MIRARSIAMVLACAGAAAAAHGQATFTNLGPGPGGSNVNNWGNAISSDGKTVVGGWEMDGGPYPGAYKWTAANGFEVIDGLPSGSGYVYANAVSNNGVVVGGSDTADGGEAIRWRTGVGTIGMGNFVGDIPYSEAAGVSDDGSVIVGTASHHSNEAFRWTEAEGMVGLGYLPGGGFERSHAYAVSGDGSIITGYGFNSLDQFEAFRWTETDGMVGIGVPVGYDGSRAFSISASGEFIIGHADSGDQVGSFIWSESAGMVTLTAPSAAYDYIVAIDVSDNGTVVGLVESAMGIEAALWTPDGTMIFLQSMIDDIASANGWIAFLASGISADGKTILLSGYDPATGAMTTGLLHIPAPGSAVLLGLGGLIATRRRR